MLPESTGSIEYLQPAACPRVLVHHMQAHARQQQIRFRRFLSRLGRANRSHPRLAKTLGDIIQITLPEVITGTRLEVGADLTHQSLCLGEAESMYDGPGTFCNRLILN